MAKNTTTAPSKVYVGMLIFTCIAMVAGIGALAMEGEEYGWERKPPTSPAKAIPDYRPVDSILAQYNTTPVAATPPEPAPMTNPEPAPATPPAPAPAPAPATPPENPATPPGPGTNMQKPAAKPVTTSNPVEDRSNEKPALLPTGPIPSPLVIPGR